MNINDKLKLVSSETIRLGNHYLIINPETGAWILVDRNGLELAQLLTGNKNLKQLFHQCGNHYQYQEITRLINILSDWGLLESTSGFKCQMTSQKSLPTLAVLNMTQNCNLACRYCYADTQHNGNPMTLKTTLRIIDEMLNLHKNTGEKVKILFHGGEPLLNFKVIKNAVECFNSSPDKIQFEIQTNASLLSEEHIKFFKKHNFTIGISVDGPKSLHDYTRPLKDGKGSFNMVIKGIERLKKENINFGAIVVLTSINWMHIEEIFDLLVNQGIRTFSINPFFAGGRGKIYNNLSLDALQLFNAYQALLHKIVEYNRNTSDSQQRVEERTLKYMIRNIILKDEAYMCMRTPCGAGLNTLGFDVNGDVYPCDDFLHEPDFILGNVNNGSLKKILDSSTILQHITSCTVHNLPKCSTCTWRKLCNGICPAHIYYERTIVTNASAECHFRQLMIPYLIELLSKNELSPNMLDREMHHIGGKHLYFNINYNCNNRCIFCASDITAFGSKRDVEINSQIFNSLLQLNNVCQGDWITINGGEPTLSKYLTDILKSVATKGAYCRLFTNGRKLSSKDYCFKVLEAGVNEISIPLYGTNSDEQDRLTGSQGSFKETIQGISNVLNLSKQLRRKVTLELKLLFFKPTLDTNPNIFRWIIREFPDVDSISLNSLIVSRVVIQRYDELVPAPVELRKSINATLDVARAEGAEALILINDIPFCLIEKRNWGFLPLARDKHLRHSNRYFDPLCMGGTQSSEENTFIPEFCHSCVYINYCRFINRLYFDDFVAIQSIKANFPEVNLVIREKESC